MSSLSSPGIGSGLNVNQLVSQLVAAERAPGDRRLARAEAALRADQTAFGAIRANLSTLRSALSALGTGDAALPARRAVVGANAGFTATAAPTAALGRYSVEVQALALAERRQSAAVSPTADLGTGTLSLSVGGESLAVSLGATTTLAQLRDAINRDAGSRVSATVVNGDAGSVLLLSSLRTGAANGISISATGSIASFTDGLVVQATAQDARVSVNGVVRSSAENRIAEIATGITLDLTRAEPATSFALDVQADSGNVGSLIQNFINAYNSALTTLRTATAFNAATGQAGALNGDAAARALTEQLRQAVGGGFDQLAPLGISGSREGTLSFDAARLSTALAADPRAATRVFSTSQDGSVGGGLKQRLDAMLAPREGVIDARTTSISQRLSRLDAERQTLNQRIDRVEAGFRRQFTALDGLVAQLQTTQTFLTRELARLPGASPS